MHLVTAAQMREMDKITIESFGLPGIVLMENAGRGATQVLFDTYPDIIHQRVGILAGRGNNGGDGFVVARYLYQKGGFPTVFLLTEKKRIAGDAEFNMKLLEQLDVPVIEISDKKLFQQYQTMMLHQNIWIDAILGTGISSDVKGLFREIIEFINTLKQPVLSIDIPSGLHSDTGLPCGTCIQAETTVTFAYAKTGHAVLPGAVFTGNLHIIDIGIPPHIEEKVKPDHFLITRQMITDMLYSRPLDAHKGTSGHLMIVAGSPGKTGAAAMAAMSAMRSGAGLVTLGIPKSLNTSMESITLEVMTLPLPETDKIHISKTALPFILEQLAGKNCLALGPGIGTEPDTIEIVRQLLSNSPVPVVLDADGINCIADTPEILKQMKSPCIITPHPGEMARLTGRSSADIQKNRIEAARETAVKYNIYTVLKGAGTIIAYPDGNVFINCTGNPGMASGGMGDVLTGIISALTSQGYDPGDAALIGVYLHGAAGDQLSKDYGPIGYLAGDVMNEIPGQLNELFNGSTTEVRETLIQSI